STFDAMLPPARSPPAIPTGGILGGHPAVRANYGNSAIAGGILGQYTDPGSRSSLQQTTFNPSARGPLGGLSSTNSDPSFNPAARLPVPSPPASWAALQLSRLPAESRGESFDARQIADDSPVLSDAESDTWLPDAQYANRTTRRSGRRA